MLALGDLARRPSLFLACWFVACLAWLAAVLAARREPPRLGTALLVAALLRVLLLPVPPALSSDAWRYLWDGRVVLALENPSRLAPDAPELAALRPGSSWEDVEHREVPTVYPPAALGLFSISAATAWPLVTWKTTVAVADLLCCWWLLLLARREGIALHRPLAYLWCPLPVLEGAGMGHLDVLAVTATVGALLALRRLRPGVAGLAAAFGVLLKLAPAAAWPLLARASARPRRFLLVASAVGVVGLLPMAAGGLPRGLVTYAVHWEHGGPLYEPLWRLLGTVRLSEGLAAVLAAAEERLGLHTLFAPLFPWLYPQLLAKVLLALLAVAAVVRSAMRSAGREDRPVAATGELFAALLLCSATLYPWYLLWVLPFAALCGRRSWLWAAAASPLAYLPALAGLPLWPWPFLALWIPFWVLRWKEGPWPARIA